MIRIYFSHEDYVRVSLDTDAARIIRFSFRHCMIDDTVVSNLQYLKCTTANLYHINKDTVYVFSKIILCGFFA